MNIYNVYKVSISLQYAIYVKKGTKLGRSYDGTTEKIPGSVLQPFQHFLRVEHF